MCLKRHDCDLCNPSVEISPCLLSPAGSVLLRDIQALTLYRNRYTTARRSNPIPQLKCVGGSAGCHAFVPEVVQCVNKGWNGVDVQVRDLLVLYCVK